MLFFCMFLVYSSWVIRKPISQFDLLSSYFRPVLTLSILTVFLYIYRCLQVLTGLGDGAAARDEVGGGGGPCDMYFCACMFLSMRCI